MTRARTLKNRYNRCGGCGNPVLQIGKPFLIGLLAALVVAMAFVMLFALVFVIMKSIVSSAVIPLSVIALMAGCFVGGWSVFFFFDPYSRPPATRYCQDVQRVCHDPIY